MNWTDLFSRTIRKRTDIKVFCFTFPSCFSPVLGKKAGFRGAAVAEDLERWTMGLLVHDHHGGLPTTYAAHGNKYGHINKPNEMVSACGSVKHSRTFVSLETMSSLSTSGSLLNGKNLLGYPNVNVNKFG